jgi:hypothetical protein
MWLHMVRNGVERPAIAVLGRPRTLGRARDCDHVIADPSVSSHHASVWFENGCAWIRDLGSRNGTWIDRVRVSAPAVLNDGARVRLGSTIEFVARAAAPVVPTRQDAVAVEDVETMVRHPFFADRFFLGDSDHADLRVADAGGGVALFLDQDGDVWRSTVDDDGPLELGEVFTCGGRRFRVVADDGSVGLGATIGDARLPFRLTLTLDGVAGAEAIIDDPQTGTRHVVDAENRAVLLYALAKRAVDARSTGNDDDAWCSDEDITRDVWGRRSSTDANSLHVLVHRLRKELKEAGFDPWFIEKRRKAIRLALPDIVIK